jgi:hypothetical protein
MRAWPFRKEKTPGFGIGRGYYLSVLSSRATLPSVLQIVNPKGEYGAVPGFGAPLTEGADKEMLGRPMASGAWALASPDRKTVLRMVVASKEEAGFDPEAFANSPLAVGIDPEMMARIRGTWTLMQLAFESHDPAVYPSLDFMLGVCARMAQMSDGVVADAVARRYLMPEHVVREERLDPRVDVREHVAVQFAAVDSGIHAFTLGMQKFNLPEYEILGLLDGDEDAAARFLLAIGQSALLGDLTENGDRFGARGALFEAREGGFDRALWGETAVFELLPPTGTAPSEALREWRRTV